MFSLRDKVALVTGASQGIGRDTALALAEAGAKVAVAARNEEKLSVLVADIAAAGGTALAVKMDVADAEQVKAGFKQVIEKFGRLDILVNNAAITRDGLAMRMKQDDWEAVIRTNLTGAHLCIQQALHTMIRLRAGRIINIASVVGQMGNAGQANYVAAKAGLIGLTKSVARELASRNVTANAVTPGYIETDMTAGLGEDVKAEFNKQIPLGRMGSPADIAAAVAWLGLGAQVSRSMQQTIQAWQEALQTANQEPGDAAAVQALRSFGAAWVERVPKLPQGVAEDFSGMVWADAEGGRGLDGTSK